MDQARQTWQSPAQWGQWGYAPSQDRFWAFYPESVLGSHWMGMRPSADGGGARVTQKTRDEHFSQDKEKTHKKVSSSKTDEKNVKSVKSIAKTEKTKEKAGGHKGATDKGRIHARRTGDNSFVFTF